MLPVGNQAYEEPRIKDIIMTEEINPEPKPPLEEYDRRWKHPQAKWGDSWERPLSAVGLIGFAIFAVMFFLSQAGII